MDVNYLMRLAVIGDAAIGGLLLVVICIEFAGGLFAVDKGSVLVDKDDSC